MKTAFFYLCTVTFDGIHSQRWVSEREEWCYVKNAKFVYVQTYDTQKPFDMARLWSICTDRCTHLAEPKNVKTSTGSK